MGRRSDIDWDVIERDYRIALLTMRQLAEKHHVDTSSISRRANKEGWQRDLAERVNQLTNNRIANSLMIDEEVEKMHTENHLKSTQADMLAVELSSKETFEIVRGHYQIARYLESLMLKMLDEIEEQIRERVILSELKTMLHESDPRAALALHNLTSVGSRMNTLKAATDIHEKIVKIERQAFNIGQGKEQRLPELERAIFALRNHPEYIDYTA